MRLASPTEFAVAYTCYRHHPGYQRRAQLLAVFPDPILVVGCGFGFLVNELRQLGRDAWGSDASVYCCRHRVTDRFIHHDILTGPLPLTAATVVTEDLLPWLTDREARLCANNCALIAPIVLHFVTEQGQADYNYHSTGYWTALTSQLTFSLEGM
jgi:hypothetical protein